VSEHPVSDLLAPYALSALPEDERHAVEAHLETCAACRDELADLCLVTGALARAVTPMKAPAPLRDRIMETVRSEAELLQAAGPGADRPARPRGSRVWSLGPFRIGPVGVATGAVAVLVAAVLGFALGDRSTTAPGRPVVTAARVSPQAGPAARARFEVAGDRTTLRVTHFRGPGRGRIYQVWLKPAKNAALKATPELFTVGQDGSAAVYLPAAARRAYRVMVTSEPSGGAPAGIPTRSPVLQGSL
jgi:anti-sigma-K factor RskA